MPCRGHISQQLTIKTYLFQGCTLTAVVRQLELHLRPHLNVILSFFFLIGLIILCECVCMYVVPLGKMEDNFRSYMQEEVVSHFSSAL